MNIQQQPDGTRLYPRVDFVPNRNPTDPLPPVPVYHVYLPATNGAIPTSTEKEPTKGSPRGSSKDESKVPLLTDKNQHEYAIYNPKRVVVYAQKSKRNCCCIALCLGCTFCCCLFFCIALVLGSIVAAFAASCRAGNVTSNASYSLEAFNLTSLQFNNDYGRITITFAQNATANVTINLVRHGITQTDLDGFNTSITIVNGQLMVQETLSNADPSTVWEQVLGCRGSDMEITLPSYFATIPNIAFVSKNSDLTFSLSSYNITFGSIQLNTTNGDAKISGASASSIVCATTNGDVTCDSVRANSIFLSSTNGDVKNQEWAILYGANPTFTAQTTNGDVSLNKVVVVNGTTINFSSTNGGLNANFEGFQGSFDVRTTNGGMTLEGNNINYNTNDKKHKTGTVGEGKGTSTAIASTTNGDVTINFS